MIFSKLYLPFIIFLVSVILIIRLKRNSHGYFTLDIFSIIQMTIPISLNISFKGIYIKFLLTIISLYFLFSYYFYMDYSTLFPQYLKMTVQFNEQKGIDDLIKDFNIKNIDDLEIKKDSLYIEHFFSDTDKTILSHTSYNHFFYDCVITKENSIEITGNAEFRIKKMDGFQEYIIDVAKGELTNNKILKNKGVQYISSEFNKISSPNDKLSLKTLKSFNEIIISPQFNQIISIKDNKGRLLKIPQENLYGVTKVTIFPVPKFSNTLYLVKHGNYLTPIGYAVYY